MGAGWKEEEEKTGEEGGIEPWDSAGRRSGKTQGRERDGERENRNRNGENPYDLCDGRTEKGVTRRRDAGEKAEEDGKAVEERI